MRLDEKIAGISEAMNLQVKEAREAMANDAALSFAGEAALLLSETITAGFDALLYALLAIHESKG